MDVFAKTVYGEARGETWRGKIAVAWVIKNRLMSKKWGTNYVSVCLAPRQFSCWNKDDVNYARIKAVTFDNEDLQKCLAAAAAAHFSIELDPTRGALHYAAERITPNWASNDYITIGGHKFYRGVK
jgi:spore germination cell wall hydrolase CwlJ-like protein